MGLRLQTTNITRDLREDVEERRYFWSRETWAGERYGGGFGRVELREDELGGGGHGISNGEDLAAGRRSHAPPASSALRHAPPAFGRLPPPPQEQPLRHPLATLELYFRNPRVFGFGGNMKIRKKEGGGCGVSLHLRRPQNIAAASTRREVSCAVVAAAAAPLQIRFELTLISFLTS
ncbi:hypothetical protein DFH09DRAFT_1331195 [Mycena vulgaris]|nr:hypothetical protein DFH09DRAFT_1331195 [Mycena vulgaris]